MKIGLAQMKSIKGDVETNIQKHVELIDRAARYHADFLLFPELSITGYEPSLANDLAIDAETDFIDHFQTLSDTHQITLGIGAPIKSTSGIQIGMLIFEPNKKHKVYSKRYLHQDETPFFVPGDQQVLLNIKNQKIAPAICYESLQEVHMKEAKQMGAVIYAASVAKPQNGVDRALRYFPDITKKYKIPALMANSVGPCDSFESVGKSSAWNKKGQLIGQLDASNEGLLIVDLQQEQVQQEYLK